MQTNKQPHGHGGPSPRQAARRRSAFDRAFDVEVARALGDPARLELLSCVLKCGRACAVGEIATCCDLDLSTVSRHLARLEKAGLLAVEKRGREKLYSADAAAIGAWFRGVADAIEDGARCADDGCC